MLEQRFADGLSLRRQGTAPQPTLLYIHGLGESGLCFEGIMTHPRLRDFHHLAPDLPGYGKTPWPPRVPDLQEHALTLEGWIRGRDPGPLIVVGHSMGGVIGQLLCEASPELVRGFVDVEGNLSIDDCSHSAKIAAYEEQEFVSRARFSYYEALYQSGREDPALQTYYASTRMCDPRVLHRNAHELVELSRGEGLASRLAALEVPRVYLLGEPRGTAERSQALLRQAGIEPRSVGPAGHWPFLDQPEDFVGELLSFLEALRGHPLNPRQRDKLDFWAAEGRTHE